MTTVKIGAKGQIVIPKEVRDLFGLNVGDSLILMADRGQGHAAVCLCRIVLERGARHARRGQVNALEVCGLKKVYPSFTLEKVSFSLEEGRVCGLVGANGAGKSTILKGIVGLIRTEGEAKVFGYPSCGEAGKALFGYAGGGFRCYPQKRIVAIARAAAAFCTAWDSDGFHRYCSRFSLDPRKKVAELSEGMKVKFALALALSHGAKLLVLDEPTSGLDPLSREEFCDVVLSLVREKGAPCCFPRSLRPI